MITYKHEGGSVFMRLSCENPLWNNRRQSPINDEAFYELEINQDHARALLDKNNWNNDVDYEELVFQHGFIKFHMPKEECIWGYNGDKRLVMTYKEWSWHLTIEEIEELEDELKKLI